MASIFILVPFFSIVLLNLPLGGYIRKLAFWLAGTVALGQIALILIHPFTFWSVYPDKLGPFFSFRLAIDSLTLLMLLSIGIVVLTALIVARGSIRSEGQQFNFVNLLLVTLIGMNATVLVTDLFSQYIFVEATAVASFILIALYKDRHGLEGAFKYLILSAIATVLMLFSIALLLLVAGDTSFVAVYGALGESTHTFLIKLAMALFICGLCIKSGVVPFHAWLPDAYTAAPAPVSVLLAGIVTKVSGVYALIRIMISVFGFSLIAKNVLLFLGTASILWGALQALTQNNFKRMLSYSSISQVGYIIVGLGCATPLALAGAAFHLFNHAIFKSLLFVNAAALEEKTGTLEMDKMGGLSAKMPFTGVTSIIGFLSTAGIPPLSGFWSKFLIVLALWQSERYAFAVIALLASTVTLGYFLTMQRKVFFGKLSVEFGQIKEAGAALVVPAVILACIIIGTGLGFSFMLNTFMLPIGTILH